MFSHKNRYLYILLLAVYTYINTALCQVYVYFQINIDWYNAFLIILLITFFVWECNRLLQPLFFRWLPAAHEIIKRSVIFFFAGLTAGFIATIAVDLFFAEVVLHEVSPSILNPLKLTLLYTSLINLLFHLLNLVFVYQKAFQTKLVEAESLKRMHAQAELQAIKQQINPHFLFNNLNVLSGLVMKQSSEANNFIEAFSQVYMHVLNNLDKEMIELKKELDFLKPYFFLLSQRFPDALELDINVQEKYARYYIIPAALQMLVENVIKHNVFSKKKPLKIKIYSNSNETVSVTNNLQPKLNQVTSSNIGLNNISKRYDLTTGKQITVQKTETAFCVILPLIEINRYENPDN